MTLFLALLAQAATAASPAPAAPTPFTNLDDAKIVCRTIAGTGSRLSTQRLCLPKREWQRMWDNSKETMGSLQNNQSKQYPQGDGGGRGR